MHEVSFADLKGLLGQLGFAPHVVPGSHVLFQAPEADRRILLRLYQAADPVEAAGLAYVRFTLDAWGLMGRDEFDVRMRERSLAG